jgi:hypothetical protein
VRLTGGGFEARVNELAELLRADGEVTLRETPAGTSPAIIDFRIKSPGGGAGHNMSFRYTEVFETSDGAWTLIEYVYLMSSSTGLGQREYHWHPLRWSGGVAVYHAHCMGAGRAARGHFRSHRILLEEAREEFLRTYAGGDEVDCRDLYPLSEPRT